MAADEASLTAALALPCDMAMPLRIAVASMVLSRQVRPRCPTWITGIGPDQAQLKAASHGYGFLATASNLTLENIDLIGFDTGVGPGVGVYPQLRRVPGSQSRSWQAARCGHTHTRHLASSDRPMCAHRRSSAVAVEEGAGMVRISRCRFERNHGSDGGALAAGPGVRLRVEASLFVSNRAEVHGGAIFHRGGRGASPVPLEVLDSTFRFNSAQFGGGVEAYYARVRVLRSVFVANHAQFGGTALRVYGGCPADCCACPSGCPCHEVSDGVVSRWPVHVEASRFVHNLGGRTCEGCAVSLNGPSATLHNNTYLPPERNPQARLVKSSGKLRIS